MYVWCNKFMKFEGARHWHCRGKGSNSVQVILTEIGFGNTYPINSDLSMG